MENVLEVYAVDFMRPNVMELTQHTYDHVNFEGKIKSWTTELFKGQQNDSFGSHQV